jgi:DNA-directed RNA polymerase specialized sigma24 family protein
MATAEALMGYWPNLIGKARATLPWADPVLWEDAAAAAIADACRRIVGQDLDPLPWLLTTVKRRALDLIESADYRHMDRPTDPTYRAIGRARIDAGSDVHLATMVVRDAVRRLPPHLAEYGAGRAGGLGIIEAGARCGWPRSTASRREGELLAQLKILIGGGA